MILKENSIISKLINLYKKEQAFIYCIGFLFLAIILRFKSYGDRLDSIYAIQNSFKNSLQIIDLYNYDIKKVIDKVADGYKSINNESCRLRATKLEYLEKDFNEFIWNIQKNIFDAAGGVSDVDRTKSVNDHDKYIVGKLMGINNPNNTGTKGFELEQRIKEFRAKLIELSDNDSIVIKGVPLNIDQIPSNENNKDRVYNKFRNIPVVAAFPLLSKVAMDAKLSVSLVMEYLTGKVKTNKIVFDKYAVCIAPRSGSVIKGEKFEADIYIASYTSKPPENTSFSINNVSLPIINGVTKYSKIMEMSGINTVKAQANFKNNFTGEEKTVSTNFDFEVGNNANLVSTDQKDILYIGIDNPIFISPIGIDPNKVKLNISGQKGASFKKIDFNHYKVKVIEETKEGEYFYITASGKGYSDKKAFIIKHLPDPQTRLGKLKSGQVRGKDFKSYTHINAILQDFEYDVKCKVTGFNMIRIPQEKQLVKLTNEGSVYNSGCKDLAKQAIPGDVYCFEKVKARCPGDQTDRNISPMVFNIK